MGDYTITNRNGIQIPMKKLDDETITKLGFAATGRLRKVMMHMLEVRREALKRNMEHPTHLVDVEPFTVMENSFILALNDFNHQYKGQIEKYGVPFNTNKYPHCKEEEEEEEECDHLNYRDTMTGAVCNDCGKEEEE